MDFEAKRQELRLKLKLDTLKGIVRLSKQPTPDAELGEAVRELVRLMEAADKIKTEPRKD